MTRKELVEKFAEHCGECKDCSRCRFYSETCIGACIEAYLGRVNNGVMTLEDSFEEANPEDDDD